ncbi:MAG: hypothetical protein ACI8ZN_001512 [Bacteroidia bacterium]|jgi:hypothetical protein
MLKQFILLSICCLTLNAFAQDTLVFKNGNVLPTIIDSVDLKNQVISYQSGSQYNLVSLTIIQRYFYQNSWHESEVFGDTLVISESFFKYIIGDYFKKPYEFGSPVWRVHTNLGGLLNYNDADYGYATGFQSARLISLEPEYLMGNWAIKFPLLLGIENPKIWNSPDIHENDFGNYDYASHYRGSPKVNGLPDYHRLTTKSDEQNQILHYLRTQFQMGVYPKYYFLGHQKRSFFLSTGLSFGIGDVGSVKHFETLDPYNNSNWNNYIRISTVEKNAFNYVRYELLLGFEINAWKNWSITGELGGSTAIQNNGTLEDNIVYARMTSTSEYEEVLRYPFRRQQYVLVGNIYLGYRLHKGKKEGKQ